MRGNVTPSSLFTMSVGEIIESLSNTVLNDIPEGINGPNDIDNMEYLLGKLPNDYAYVISLLGNARSYVRQLKRKGMKEQYEDMMDKRDALSDIASAIKLKYQGLSRMVTTFEQRNNSTEMWEYRKKRQ